MATSRAGVLRLIFLKRYFCFLPRLRLERKGGRSAGGALEVGGGPTGLSPLGADRIPRLAGASSPHSFAFGEYFLLKMSPAMMRGYSLPEDVSHVAVVRAKEHQRGPLSRRFRSATTFNIEMCCLHVGCVGRF